MTSLFSNESNKTSEHTPHKRTKSSKIFSLPSAPRPRNEDDVGLCYRLIISNAKRDRLIFLVAAGVHLLSALMILFSQPTEAGLLANFGFRWLLKGLVANGAFSMSIFAFIACALTRPDSKATATLHGAAKKELRKRFRSHWQALGGWKWMPFYAQTPEQLRLRQLYSLARSNFKVACARTEVRFKRDKARIWSEELCPVVMEVLHGLQTEFAEAIEQFELEISHLHMHQAGAEYSGL